MDENSKVDIYKKSRLFYILYSTTEYFISILVGTTYLAKLAGAIGIDDATVGVLSSFVSLGCGFQIVALFFNNEKPVKRLVTTMLMINQLAFALLYAVPFFDVNKNLKTAVFITLLLMAYILQNVIFSPQKVWMRALVDPDKQGVFAAKCETTSLVSGMAFTMIMGRMIDKFEEKGNLKGAFIVLGVTIFVLTAINLYLLLSIKEKPKPILKTSVKEQIKASLFDKPTLLLIPVFILWHVALYITTPFFGTYQLNDLGFNMTVVSALSVVYAIVRSLASRPMGKYGDKHSFINMMTICYALMGIALLVNGFGGAVCYVIYYLIYAVLMAGANSGKLNIIYDYVSPDKRVGSVAILFTIGGFSGFFATLAVKPLVSYIQENNNTFLGIEGIYAQQVLSIAGAFLMLLCVIYLNIAVRRLPTPERLLRTDD